MEEAPEFIVAMKLKQLEDYIPGGKEKPCSECKEKVYLTPVSLDLIKQHKVKPICSECLQSRIDKGEINPQITLAKQQIDEIIEHNQLRNGECS